jgi:putative acetyltransferase
MRLRRFSSTLVMVNKIKIRVVTASDIPALEAVYRDSVKAIAPQRYSPEQVEAWAYFPSDTEAFNNFIFNPTTFVAEIEGIIVGFSGCEKNGHIASLYVRGDYNHQGIGSRLLETVITSAKLDKIPRLYTEASEFSRALFEKFGFQVSGTENLVREGVWFHRYLMDWTCDNYFLDH